MNPIDEALKPLLASKGLTLQDINNAIEEKPLTKKESKTLQKKL